MALPVESSAVYPSSSVSVAGEAAQSTENNLSVGLFVIVSVVLAFLMVLIATSLYFQYDSYSLAITKALAQNADDHSSVITYLRAWDFAVVKVSSVFLSFLLIFTGALYVLRHAGTAFTATAESGGMKGSLNTTSPGLVMVTLGVVLAIAVIYSRTLVEYTPPTRSLVPVGEHELQRDADLPPQDGKTREAVKKGVAK